MADSGEDIRNRSFVFACDVAKLVLRFQPRPGIRCIVDQLLKAATSVGANLEEAKAGSSPRDFIRYVEISLRESRETLYWLRICQALQLGPAAEVDALCGEGDQIARILGSIVVKTKLRIRTGHAVFAFCVLNLALLLS